MVFRKEIFYKYSNSNFFFNAKKLTNYLLISKNKTISEYLKDKISRILEIKLLLYCNVKEYIYICDKIYSVIKAILESRFLLSKAMSKQPVLEYSTTASSYTGFLIDIKPFTKLLRKRG